MEKVRRIVKEKCCTAGSIDVLMLPEMSLTGYTFNDRKHIEPFLEEERGPTFEFCRELSSMLDCFVLAGYPRKVISNSGSIIKRMNSMCVVSPAGELLITYDKSFLYVTDETWADEGDGFKTINLSSLGSRFENVCLAICMDINPYKYRDDSLFELGNFAKERGSKLILLLANWLVGGGGDVRNYWAYRLKPLLDTDCILVVANRIGIEDTNTFCGLSCAISLKERKVLGSLGSKEEDLLIVSIPKGDSQ